MRIFIFLFTYLLFTPLTFGQNNPSSEWEHLLSPTFSGWDESKLETLEEYLIDSTAATGLMIVQDGKVVYQYGNVSENSYIASCRKSILSMLYGKYVDNGTIQLNQSLKSLKIDCDGLLSETEQKVTIEDIISSRSGIYLPASNPGDMTHLAPDRGEVNPGDLWVYNNWDFNMAGHIFEELTQKNIYDEIENQFAIPLEMEDWDRSIQQKDGDRLLSDILAYHMYFSTRDMARLGVLLLNKGKWNGQQLISEHWVGEMTKPNTTFEEVDKIAPFLKNNFSEFAYGYMWWLWNAPRNEMLKGAYSAQGAWGQNITIIPKMNTVVVIKTNDVYMRQKGDHHYIMDHIAGSFDFDQQNKLKSLAVALSDKNIHEFVNEVRSLYSENTDIDFQSILNRLGYAFLTMNKPEQAISILQLNAELHPTSWNVYDSLGEAYYLNENYKGSLQNFQKALELNKDNQWNRNETIEHIIYRIQLNN